MKNPFKNLFNKKFRENEQIKKALIEAENEAIKRLTKIHGNKVEVIVNKLNTEKQIEVEKVKIEMEKVKSRNEELKKRNDYLEKLYYKTVEDAKVNSIVTQEMATDGQRLLEMVSGMVGLIHGVNNKAQRHFDKMESDKMKVKEKLRKLEEK